MLNKDNENIIFNDFWEKVNYQYRFWQDFEIAIVNDSIVYRFPKKQIDFETLLIEKKITDVVKDNVSIMIPELEIVEWKWFKYNLIQWSDMKNIDILWLSDNYKDILVNSLVNIIRELHSIPIFKFSFLEKDINQGRIYFFNIIKNKIEKRLKWKIDRKYINYLIKYIDNFSKLQFSKLSFVHTDIKKANIIIDNTKFKINWLIDFSNSRITWIEEEFIFFFLEFWEEIFNEIIKQYLWKKDFSFSEKIKFISKKVLIFQILDDDLYFNNFSYLENKIKNFTKQKK